MKAALLLEPEKTVLKNPFGGGLQDYALDKASVLPVQALDFKAGDTMADFCASPGGKSVCAIFQARGEGRWFCNDLSPARVKRLGSVMHDCLPPEVLARVTVSKSDASRWGMRFPEEFPKILLDAPCSGERHLLADVKEIARWSKKGSQRLAVRQHALLCSAFDAAAPGARIVYSTCSISPIENDGVIEKLRKSRKEGFTVAKPNPDFGEPTALGWIVLPDRFQCGPIYFSVIEKN